MKKILLAVAAIVVSINVSAMEGPGGPENNNCYDNHDAPFLGINTAKEKCCIVFNDEMDGKTAVHAKADISYTINKKFVIGTCKVTIPEGSEFDVAPGRVKVEGCAVKVMGHGKSTGDGGFTIDQDEGVISGNCKAENISE